MELEKKRVKPESKKRFRKYLFPLTIISSMFVSGLIGYAASRMATDNDTSDSTEVNAMKNQMIEARESSLKVIETEIPKIIKDLEKYNKDLNLISENIKWLDGNIAPIRDATREFDTVITATIEVSSFVNVPVVSKISDELAFAQNGIAEIDGILLGMENLTVIQQEMSDSHQKLNSLYEEYQKEKSIEQLLRIEQELNSNLVYQIEDLRDLTIEAHEVFELSSTILIAVNTVKSSLDSIEETGETALNAIQFWKDNEGDSKNGAIVHADLEKELTTSKEQIQALPDEIAQQSRDTITSINDVQEELQIVRIAQMVINE
ncbi:hypothetical protein [Planococcus lenghuensis]|uniref:Uncharacterized protein n=1 Tax=Planococcus lenghuensis TaxID=2213202 RepID=A0A1Q2L4U3_9BACL|nr:hypothetical protein [Planococcus lenghuensis]AQQ54902.1 hypothetical protein B0X71_18535 [Planococcus lenghuensis]